jgi:hypothetical protein
MLHIHLFFICTYSFSDHLKSNDSKKWFVILWSHTIHTMFIHKSTNNRDNINLWPLTERRNTDWYLNYFQLHSYIVSHGRMTVNDKLQGMWKKAAVAYRNPTFALRRGKPQRICQHSWCLGYNCSLEVVL